MNQSFNQRFGIADGKSKENEFPEKARIALMYVLEQFVHNHTINNNDEPSEGWQTIYREMLRVSRNEYTIIDRNFFDPMYVNRMLLGLEWNEVFVFCERIYSYLLSSHEYYGINHELTGIIEVQTIREEFTKEINNILSEENMPYLFDNGIFIRPGKIQTQKNINRVTAVLARPELNKVKYHFNKAYSFFSSLEKPDFENVVKEALCSLEITFDIKSGTRVSRDFSKEILKLSGSESDKIPTPISGAMVKIFGYRGSAEGVAHGIAKGLRVTSNEAELILSLVASFITYIVAFYDSLESDIPF